jgi:hypothetical protein
MARAVRMLECTVARGMRKFDVGLESADRAATTLIISGSHWTSNTALWQHHARQVIITW